ncbi:MAG: glycoside hydrolase family 10 protein [Microcystaceae cyanobacterium]
MKFNASPLPFPTSEIRAVWIVDHSNSPVLRSATNIASAVKFLKEHGFNTIFPAVWNRGYTAFPSEVMERNGFPKQDPNYKGFDPVAEMIQQGKAEGMSVLPWFEYGFAASPAADGGHILTQKPQWSALDINGNKVRHGTLTWMNSLNSEVQQFMLELVLEVIEKYPSAEGIQGCDRFPAMPFNGGYDEETKANYKAIFNSNPPKNGKESRWVQFRCDVLTQYLKRLVREIRKIKSSCIVSMSPSPYFFGKENLMQDSDRWVTEDLVDFIHPQFYRTSFKAYKNEVNRLKREFTTSQRKKFAPGIALRANNVNLSASEIVQMVQYNRSSGLSGQSFFYFEGLTKNSNEIAEALRDKGAYDKIAALPSPFTIT